MLFLWGTGLSVIRSGVLPRWLGWVMIVLGVVGLTPLGFVSAIGAAILVLVLASCCRCGPAEPRQRRR